MMRFWKIHPSFGLARTARRLCVVGAVFVLAVGFSSRVAAQAVQVPFDRDSTLYTIDPELRTRLNLFPSVSKFEGAELYRTDSTTYELVIRYRKEGRLRRGRRTLSATEVEALRQKIAKGRTGAEGRKFTQAGRYDLLGATTVHGLAEGILLTQAFRIEGVESLTLPLLGGTVGFFAPLLATRKARVTEAEADMVFYGGLQGYVHAAQLTQLLGGGTVDGRAAAGIAAVMGALEGTIAYRFARQRDWSSGHGEMVTYNGLAGNVIGLGIGAIIVGEDGPPRVAAATSLLGSVGGAYLGHRLGRTDRYTNGDVRVYLQSSVLSTYLVGALLDLGEPSVRVGASLLTGSAVGGAVLGRRLVRDRDFTATQSGLLGLGAFAGLLGGAALTLDAEEEPSRVAESIGAAAGFGITYAVLQGDARRQASAKTSALDLNVHVSPSMAGGLGAGSTSSRIVPQVGVTATF